jgi:RNA recognition motif-containing protein
MRSNCSNSKKSCETRTAQSSASKLSPKLKERTKKFNPKGITRIFVHGLHPYTTKADLLETFEKVCPVKDLEFKKNTKNGKHSGFAFFTAPTPEMAQKLVDSKHVLHGRIIHCDLKHSNVKDQVKNQKRRLFIGGLPPKVKDSELVRTFEEIGEVRAAYTIKELDGTPKAFGFVDFKDFEGAQKALNSQPIFIRGKKIDLKPFSKKKKAEKYKTPQMEYNEFCEKFMAQFSGKQQGQAQMMMYQSMMAQMMMMNGMNYQNRQGGPLQMNHLLSSNNCIGYAPQQINPWSNYPQQKKMANLANEDQFGQKGDQTKEQKKPNIPRRRINYIIQPPGLRPCTEANGLQLNSHVTYREANQQTTMREPESELQKTKELNLTMKEIVSQSNIIQMSYASEQKAQENYRMNLSRRNKAEQRQQLQTVSFDEDELLRLADNRELAGLELKESTETVLSQNYWKIPRKISSTNILEKQSSKQEQNGLENNLSGNHFSISNLRQGSDETFFSSSHFKALKRRIF